MPTRSTFEGAFALVVRAPRAAGIHLQAVRDQDLPAISFRPGTEASGERHRENACGDAMRAEVLTDLLAKLDECKAGEDAKAEFRKLIHDVGEIHGTDASVCEERTQFARSLLNLRESRTVVRDRLMSRYGISRAQAYRYIAEALKTVSSK